MKATLETLWAGRAFMDCSPPKPKASGPHRGTGGPCKAYTNEDDLTRGFT